MLEDAATPGISLGDSVHSVCASAIRVVPAGAGNWRRGRRDTSSGNVAGEIVEAVQECPFGEHGQVGGRIGAVRVEGVPPRQMDALEFGVW